VTRGNFVDSGRQRRTRIVFGHRLERPVGPASRPNQFTASFRPLPALNFGCFEAGIRIFSPVRGLRPSDAARRATWKVPKPIRRTSSPCLSAAEMVEDAFDGLGRVALRETRLIGDDSNEIVLIHLYYPLLFGKPSTPQKSRGQ
jgi:hypothetical protein